MFETSPSEDRIREQTPVVLRDLRSLEEFHRFVDRVRFRVVFLAGFTTPECRRFDATTGNSKSAQGIPS